MVYDLSMGCVRVVTATGWSNCLSYVSTVGIITSLDCLGAVITGTLTDGVVASGVSTAIAYTGGNGGSHTGQVVTSTGVTGLTATLVAGNFTTGAGSLTYAITGTPASSGTASFAISIGMQSCALSIPVAAAVAGFGEVTSVTGRIWMDRNLGATQVATSSFDAASYGDLYQWGRGTDGHQIRTSSIIATLSSTDNPGHGDFITSGIAPNDWRNGQNNNLWQGVSGTNNPCPSGYRLPTQVEWNAERTSWSSLNLAGAFNSPLKLPVASIRAYHDGSLVGVGSNGNYWSSTVDVTFSRSLYIVSNAANMSSDYRAFGYSVRCIKN